MATTTHPQDFNGNGFLGTALGNHISVLAPASGIPITQASTRPGTSLAAPQVAAVVAMMLRVDSSLSSADIKDIIMRSADIVPDLYDNNVAGGRRLNAYRAVKLALGSTTVQLDPLPTLATGTNPLTTSLSTPTCLLYTSPSPRDRTRSRMPSSA